MAYPPVADIFRSLGGQKPGSRLADHEPSRAIASNPIGSPDWQDPDCRASALTALPPPLPARPRILLQIDRYHQDGYTLAAMRTLNRAAVLIQAKEPNIQWVASVNYQTAEAVQDLCGRTSVYLVPQDPHPSAGIVKGFVRAQMAVLQSVAKARETATPE